VESHSCCRLTLSPFYYFTPHEQNTIGWCGVLHEFNSKLWVHHQHHHLEHNNPVMKIITGSLWLISLLSGIWDHIFMLPVGPVYSYTTLHGATTSAKQALILTTPENYPSEFEVSMTKNLSVLAVSNVSVLQSVLVVCHDVHTWSDRHVEFSSTQL
jgi:hypothetical protein